MNLSTSFVYLSDIAPNPALKILDASAEETVAILGDIIQFHGSIAPLTGQPPYQYLWDFGDGETSPQLNPTHVYTSEGEFTFTFTVLDQAGDTDTKAGTITIRTHHTPTITCFTDSTINRIIIVTTNANTRWSDLEITTNNQSAIWQVFSYQGLALDIANHTDGIPTDVTAGDYIQLSGTTGNVTVTLSYIPTSEFIGTWTVDLSV